VFTYDINIYTHAYMCVHSIQSSSVHMRVSDQIQTSRKEMPYQGLLWFRKRYRCQKINDDRYGKSFHYDQTPTNVLVKDHLLPGCIIFFVYIMEIVYRSKVSKF